jgi:2'-5' RNA ligase
MTTAGEPMGDAETALLVPVLVADATVGSLRGRLDPAARLGLPAHVTVSYPFAAADALDSALLDELRSLFAHLEPFDFSLTHTAWFGDGVLWLAPEPSDPFRELTAAVLSRWPQHRPYGGRFADVIPHLTVGDGAARGELRAAEVQVASALPIAGRATEVALMSGTKEPGSWKTRASFPLGALHVPRAPRSPG